MAKRRKKYNEPSRHAIRNDRGNYLGNAQGHLHLVVNLTKKFRDSGATESKDQVISKLIELTDKCSSTLKQYINARNFMEKDELNAEIRKELGKSQTYTEFDLETRWLSHKFGELCVASCQQFIESGAEANIQSMESLYNRIVEFREQFRRIYDSADLRGNFESHLDEILKIAIGTALVCEDGLKYYKSTGFSARSIWLGARMFLVGTETLLQLGNAGEM